MSLFQSLNYDEQSPPVGGEHRKGLNRSVPRGDVLYM